MASRGVTIRDVARVAGVSASTVSRALGGGTVEAGTRDAVLAAAARLGYRPNRSARGLVTGRTGAIGVLVPDLGNPFFAEVVKGVSARVRGGDHPVLVSDTDEDPEREQEMIESLRRTTDGLVLCSPRVDDERLLAVVDPAATVVVSRRVPGLACVAADAAAGAAQALTHLAALGHRRVAYVAGPAVSWIDHERARGLTSAATLGVRLVTVPSAAPTFEAGVAAADLVLATGVGAVVAFNDLLALGLLHRFAARGVSVPSQVSVVGHDDIAMAAMCTPALTTVATATGRLGGAAADLLLRLIGGVAAGPREVVLPAGLVVRASTGPAHHP